MRHVMAATDLASSLPAVGGMRVQLQQVLMNLFMNAADAMEANPVEERQLVVATAVTEAGVRICVSDCGPGIAEADLKNIFEPFWSSKPGGMGMGLAICRSIVSAHGGSLTANNSTTAEQGFRSCCRRGRPLEDECRMSPVVFIVDDDPEEVGTGRAGGDVLMNRLAVHTVVWPLFLLAVLSLALAPVAMAAETAVPEGVMILHSNQRPVVRASSSMTRCARLWRDGAPGRGFQRVSRHRAIYHGGLLQSEGRVSAQQVCRSQYPDRRYGSAVCIPVHAEPSRPGSAGSAGRSPRAAA